MPHNQDPIVSTGRGGAGNIGRDPTVYTDGEIVREGFEGEAHEPEYSTGRGGAGNIGSPRILPTTAERRRSQDIVPEQALRGAGAGYDNYHTGRGGEGNIHKDRYGGHSGPQPDKAKESLGDKVKKIFHADGKKSGDGTPGSTA